MNANTSAILRFSTGNEIQTPPLYLLFFYKFVSIHRIYSDYNNEHQINNKPPLKLHVYFSVFAHNFSHNPF